MLLYKLLYSIKALLRRVILLRPWIQIKFIIIIVNVCVCVRACERACVRVCVCVCVRAYMCDHARHVHDLFGFFQYQTEFIIHTFSCSVTAL